MEHLTLIGLLLTCAPQVDTRTALALIRVESTSNPHAIGVVGGQLERQPRHRAEALATAKALQRDGWNFSVGLAQINVHNLDRLGLSLDTAFEPCRNLGAMQAVLGECHQRANQRANKPGTNPQHALRLALSCYYSGNFSTGFRHGYVQRIERASRDHPLPVAEPSSPDTTSTPQTPAQPATLTTTRF
jgi:type IV secretion system protein VirB1